MTHVNTATHPVDLADGRVIPAGRTATPSSDPHDQALVADGTLAAITEEAPAPRRRATTSDEGGAR